jgi:glycosyltransferase involved in cell wall biosynthesis
VRTFPRAPRSAGDTRPMRIGLIAPPVVSLPPPTYAGTERIVTSLALGLHARGHEVTVFTTGDSDLPCEIVPIVPRALWRDGMNGDLGVYFQMAVARAWDEANRFDVIHSHVETQGFQLAQHAPVPVVTTLHGRLDVAGTTQYIDQMRSIPLVAISESQRRWNPDANWVATIHHGIDFTTTPSATRPGDYLLFVGRITREKGVDFAIELARRTNRRLVIAAKAHEQEEQALFDSVVRPAIDEGIVDWRGEVDSATRDQLMVRALATVMLGAWPEPFGLVAIESMATGTPVIARRAGGLTETIDHGVTGFLVDDVEEAALAVSRAAALDRAEIARTTRQRFSADRMVDAYEAVYRSLVAPARVESETAALGETEVEPLDREVERVSSPRAASARDLIAAGTR